MFRVPLSRWVTLFVASGFVFLLVDVGHAHHYTLGKHPWAWTPLVFAPVGALAFAIAGGTWRPMLLRLSQVAGVLAVVVGLMGTYFHNEERFEEEQHSHDESLGGLRISPSAWAHTEESVEAAKQAGDESAPPEELTPPAAASEEGRQHEEASSATAEPPPTRLQQYYADRHPPLAPLAFAGLGGLGVLAAGFGLRRIQRCSGRERPAERGEE